MGKGKISVLTAVICLASSMLLAADDAREVEATKLDGSQLSGPLASVSDGQLVLSDTDASRISLDELVSVRFTSPVKVPAEAIEVRMVSGTVLTCSQLTTRGPNVSIESLRYGKATLSLPRVASIRLAAANETLMTAWAEMLERENRRDRLVIVRKGGEALSQSSGTIGSISDKAVNFVLDGEEIPLNRQRVFGIVYARSPQARTEPLCRIDVGGGDTLLAKSVSVKDAFASVTTLGGIKLSVDVSAIQAMDFSSGKIRYLSDMEPREAKLTPFIQGDEAFLTLFPYRRDETVDRQPLRIGDREYARGLWIHSKTLLRYRIAGDYSRFQAVMGIDDEVAREGLGDVEVRITGDGKALHESRVKAGDAPVPLDLDVTGVRDLEILVDFGRKSASFGDWLDLADAKVVR